MENQPTILVNGLPPQNTIYSTGRSNTLYNKQRVSPLNETVEQTKASRAATEVNHAASEVKHAASREKQAKCCRLNVILLMVSCLLVVSIVANVVLVLVIFLKPSRLCFNNNNNNSNNYNNNNNSNNTFTLRFALYYERKSVWGYRNGISHGDHPSGCPSV